MLAVLGRAGCAEVVALAVAALRVPAAVLRHEAYQPAVHGAQAFDQGAPADFLAGAAAVAALACAAPAPEELRDLFRECPQVHS